MFVFNDINKSTPNFLPSSALEELLFFFPETLFCTTIGRMLLDWYLRCELSVLEDETELLMLPEEATFDE